MSTDREKSFLATLWVEGVPVEFFKIQESGGNFSNVPSEYMCANSNAHDPAPIYFRYRHDHYVLYSRRAGGCIGMVGETENLGRRGYSTRYFFSAGAPDDDSIHVYLLNSANQRLTLDNFSWHEVTVGVLFRSSHTILREEYSLYLAEKNKVSSQWWARLEGVLAGTVPNNPVFTLKILERNVPYLDDPYEV